MACAEANFFHNGFDRIDGIFFDTGSTRGPKNFGQQAEDDDIQTHVEIVSQGSQNRLGRISSEIFRSVSREIRSIDP